MEYITLGADPEGILFNSYGNPVPASDYYPSHDSISAVSKKHSVVKTDGYSYLAEIEIPPASNAVAATEAVREAIQQIRDDHLEIKGGAYVRGHSIGGHIHLSVSPDSDLLNILDKTTGTLSYLVDKNQYTRYIRSSYGKYRAYESKSYGFEYRTPPSWLVSYEWTLAFFSLTHMVARAYKEDDIATTQCIENIKDGMNNRHKLRERLKNFKKSFPHLYNGAELSPIFRLIKVGGDWFSNKSFEQRWHL